jgi:hypothetical protein
MIQSLLNLKNDVNGRLVIVNHFDLELSEDDWKLAQEIW